MHICGEEVQMLTALVPQLNTMYVYVVQVCAQCKAIISSRLSFSRPITATEKVLVEPAQMQAMSMPAAPETGR